MKHYVASLLCVAMLAGLVALFALVVTGGYERLALDGVFAAPTWGEIMSSAHRRKILLAVLVALGFAALDIQSLATRGESEQSGEPKPCDDPLGFAALRARRYCLLLFLLFYAAVAMHATGAAGIDRTDFTRNAVFALTAVFAVTRRPLDWAVSTVFGFLLSLMGSFLKGFAGH